MGIIRACSLPFINNLILRAEYLVVASVPKDQNVFGVNVRTYATIALRASS